ncbi:methyltransferase domain-containing protein [Bdellovibrio sp.]|uniref:methyltransferase domain-containing protein n=1 Tax=Bdellovibrio sp. TaxID=28201 RepID=UPI0039E70715
MNWVIKRSKSFPDLHEFKNGMWRSFLDLQFRSILQAEKDLGLDTPQGCVLDFGAGSQILKQRMTCREYHSVDPNFEATWKSLEEIPQGRQFDLIAALEVFEHLRDPANILQTLTRHQDLGKKIYITTPFLAREHGAPEDFQRWTAEGMKELLTSAGYRVEKIVKRGNGVSVVSSYLNFALFRMLTSRYFVLAVLLAPIAVILLLIAHFTLRRSSASFYLGLSVLASKEADRENSIHKD